MVGAGAWLGWAVSTGGVAVSVAGDEAGNDGASARLGWSLAAGEVAFGADGAAGIPGVVGWAVPSDAAVTAAGEDAAVSLGVAGTVAIRGG